MSEHHELTLPDLGLPQELVTVSTWLVRRGTRVRAGERVVEILAGAATIDLSAPVSGRLSRILVHEDEPAFTGQVLAEFTADEAVA